jgi:hypothetical protein
VSSTKWGGRRVTQARAYIAAQLPAPCGKCGRPVRPGDPFVVGHVKSRALYPELMWNQDNWRAEHKACSDKSGQAAVIEKARAEGAAAATGSVFPWSGGPGQPPPLRFSPSAAQDEAVRPRSGLEWDPGTLAAYEWLRPFLELPEDAAPPLYMTPPHPEAVGSYGAEAVEWIEAAERKTLRWWQRLAIVRQLEHRADGSLCYRTVLESAPRRAGKSVRVRGVALWRMAHPERFGEPQTIVHTGSDVAICRNIQRDAWRWAEQVAHWTVTRANGKEALETTAGDRWLVRAQTSVYGYDVCLGIVDEAWDVEPETVSEGLEPATLERQSPQLHLTSTAHRRATSLMRTRLQVALTTDDPKTLLLVWAAPSGADPGDPDVWRAASPHWSEDRRQMIADKYADALAGEADPQADDPDPMAGFTAQYLNQWRLTAAPKERGNAVLAPATWAELAAQRPAGVPHAAAIESWFEHGVSLALAWRSGGRVVVSVTDHADLVEAVEVLRWSGFRRVATVGASLLEDPALTGVRTRPGQGRTGSAVQELVRYAAEGVLLHDGGAHLTDQVLAVRTLPGADGPRMASTGRADAVKAVAWVVADCRRRSVGRPRIVTL